MPFQSPMYNTYGFGGYLILTRGPEHKVFMDGRSELYERAGFLPDYYEISGIKPGALSTLQKYGIQSCLLNHGEALATLLAALPDWQKVYEDPTSVLFVRRNSSSALLQPASGGVSEMGDLKPFLLPGTTEGELRCRLFPKERPTCFGKMRENRHGPATDDWRPGFGKP